jgi:ssDNA-binding Zn-finger/Zn-ribbon topoisomerase 1
MQGYFYSFFCVILKYKRGYSMPKMKKCTICGKNFLSRNGVEVCSAACATERKHRQDTAGNERRRAQLSNQKTSRICPVCGKTFMSVRWKYCCSEYVAIARRKNSAENNREYYVQNRDAVIQRVKATRAKHKQEQQPPK